MTCDQQPCFTHPLLCTTLQEPWERQEMGTCTPPCNLKPNQEDLTSRPTHSFVGTHGVNNAAR